MIENKRMNNRPYELPCAWVAISYVAVGFIQSCFAQAPEVGYPTSQAIVAAHLDNARRSTLETFINGKLAVADYEKARSKICPLNVSRSPLNDESMKSSVIETKVDVVTEFLFERNIGASSTLPERFSFLVDFSKTRVLIQHLSARFATDAAGFSVPLPLDLTRAVRLEGKMGADLLVMIPPVRECGVQAVMFCPRQYEKVDRFVASPYTLKSWRALVDAKADGVISAPEGAQTKVMTSLRAAGPIQLPQEWFSVAAGSRTITTTKTFQHNRSQKESLPAFSPITELPTIAALESRVDMGSDVAPLRSASKRVTVEVSKFTLVDKPGLGLGRSVLAVQGGDCYMLAQWSDEIV